MPRKRVDSHVTFHFLKTVYLPRRSELKAVVSGIGRKFGKPQFNVTYVFCDDDYLLDINRRFLKHDYYTDIITFDLSDRPDAVIGEVYISVDRVRENAKELGQSFSAELARVVFHGALHLCGLKDKSRQEVALMRGEEDYFLRRLKRST